ncbi:ABC transporter substrate-binding protein [soil metagenome]
MHLPRQLVTAIALALLLGGCHGVLNEPYDRADIAGNTLFTGFQEQPKYLDPASSYSNNETPWVFQIYEPPLQYHYLKRPFELTGHAATEVPEPRYLDKDGRELPADAPTERVAQSVYTVHIRPDIRYQPHPALAVDDHGRPLNFDLEPADIDGKFSILQFKKTGSRVATADDFVYQIKRLASPYVPTPVPVYGLFSQYIVGLKDLHDQLVTERGQALAKVSDARDRWLPWRDLREVPFEGARVIDARTYEIRIVGKYPQFKYWLAMPFFAPMPWEAERFYSQRGMSQQGLTLNQWPVGTGPYMLTVKEPNRYVMERNPNYHGESYPCEGAPGDQERGLLADCGKTMPFIDKVVSSVERERQVSETKTLQGYFDIPELERLDNGFQLLSEKLDQAGRAQQLERHGVQMNTSVEPNNWYMGFNWLDPVVGKGATPDEQARHRKLRQAISIATDWEEFASIFFESYGPAEIAMSPVPPGIAGYRTGREGINPVTHVWVDGRAVRRPLEDAKKLLAEAGYPDGRDAATGQPLVLYYDAQGVGPSYQQRLDWQVKQAAKLGIQLELRNADYNRFQERMRKGTEQIFFWGWNADYPDAENFLFLLYGPQAKARFEGENAANYDNPEYNRLYNVMKDLPDGAERQKVIDRMVDIVRNDAPWMFGIFPGSVGVAQPWVFNTKATIIVRNHVQYIRLDPALRMQKITEWNRPNPWPIVLIVLLLALLGWPARRVWQRRERANARQSAHDAIATVRHGA